MGRGKAISQEQWEEHKEEILKQYKLYGRTQDQVVNYMALHHDFKISARSLRRQIGIWEKFDGADVRKKPLFYKDENLVTLIKEMWRLSFNTKTMERTLQDEKGYHDISEWAIKDILRRQGLPMRRRNVPEEDKQKVVDAVKWALESGLGVQWGIGFMQTCIRMEFDIFCSREQMWTILGFLDDKGVQSRRSDNPRKRRRFVAKGPNYRWSGDGHDKLSAYGFQIYGFMDCYSRRILGLFVGLSNRTTVAVQKFFLKLVRRFGLPKLVRSDKGTETLLMAICQYALRKKSKPGVIPRKAFGCPNYHSF